MAPRVDGQVHWFQEQGLYDGLFLMKDDETGTYWDHMTGEAVYGPLAGNRLEIANLFQTNVAQVLGATPDAKVALSDRILWEDERLGLRGLIEGMKGRLSRGFQGTIKEEDDRRPTMDLGLGLWEGESSRYYPYDLIVDAGNAVLDTFKGRAVLLLLDPTAFALTAYNVEAESFEWDDSILRLSDGSYIEGGVMHGADGARVEASRPLQVFTRWYGFSLTFPGTEIYGEG